MYLTINQLKGLFKSIGDAHWFIKTTEFGDVPSFTESENQDGMYPIFNQVLNDTETLDSTVNRTFTFIIADQVDHDKSNSDDIISDCEQTANDIVKILKQESDDYSVIGNPIITPFKDRYRGRLAGVEVNIVIETLYNSGYCDIPADAFNYPGKPTQLYSEVRDVETGDLIATLYPGSIYYITVLSAIKDTIDSNTYTIIENLNP
jgi:hypothetical protein